MKKKVIILFLALLFPVAIFIFLKMFGKNEFQVPPLYQEGSMSTPQNCEVTYSVPYVVADSLFSALGMNRNDSLYVFYFDKALDGPLHRISVEFDGEPVKLVNPQSLRVNPYNRYLEECVLLMRGDTSVALVDNKNRIRGYYNGEARDEVDRLILEMKIILKQY
ncbi:MAG TPA: hypothetical protein VFZ78_05510 [Flavisolibacter sp.]